MSSGEKRTVSGFEKFVFAVTRVFALCGAAAVVIGIIILAMKLLSPGGNTNVSYSEVANDMAPSAKSSVSETDATQTKPTGSLVPTPEDLKSFFARGENEKIIRAEIEDLSEAQQRDYLNNMAQIVREAKAKNVNMPEAVDSYRQLKLKKLHSNEFDKYTAIATKAGYIAGIFGLLLILSILSLVLVMLAIERNTRPVSA